MAHEIFNTVMVRKDVPKVWSDPLNKHFDTITGDWLTALAVTGTGNIQKVVNYTDISPFGLVDGIGEPRTSIDTGSRSIVEAWQDGRVTVHTSDAPTGQMVTPQMVYELGEEIERKWSAYGASVASFGRIRENGSQTFASITLDKIGFSIANRDVAATVTVSDSLDGKRPFEAFRSCVVARCANTYGMGWNEAMKAGRSMSLRHSANYILPSVSDIANGVNLAELHEIMERERKDAEALAACTVDPLSNEFSALMRSMDKVLGGEKDTTDVLASAVNDYSVRANLVDTSTATKSIFARFCDDVSEKTDDNHNLWDLANVVTRQYRADAIGSAERVNRSVGLLKAYAYDRAARKTVTVQVPAVA